jgi:hypothetical protein
LHVVGDEDSVCRRDRNRTRLRGGEGGICQAGFLVTSLAAVLVMEQAIAAQRCDVNVVAAVVVIVADATLMP